MAGRTNGHERRLMTMRISGLDGCGVVHKVTLDRTQDSDERSGEDEKSSEYLNRIQPDRGSVETDIESLTIKICLLE
jgi:hypothetical protein